jgi:hypothetical protein
MQDQTSIILSPDQLTASTGFPSPASEMDQRIIRNEQTCRDMQVELKTPGMNSPLCLFITRGLY